MDTMLEAVLAWIKRVSNPMRMDGETYREGLELLSASFRKNMAIRLRPPANPRKGYLLWVQLRYVASKLCAAAPVQVPGPVFAPANPAVSPVPGQTLSLAKPEGKPRFYPTPWSEIRVSRLDWELLPDPLKAEYFRKGKLFNDAAVSHRRLAFANFGKDPKDLSPADQAENARLASVILSNFETVNHIWKQIDYFVEHKKPMPPEGKQEAGTPGTVEEVNRRLHIKRSNLHTYRKRLPRMEDPEQRKRAYAKIVKLEQEVEDLKELRKKLKRRGYKQ